VFAVGHRSIPSGLSDPKRTVYRRHTSIDTRSSSRAPWIRPEESGRLRVGSLAREGRLQEFANSACLFWLFPGESFPAHSSGTLPGFVCLPARTHSPGRGVSGGTAAFSKRLPA
jgi:hypothetical protein